MQITEADRLRRDVEDLIRARKMLDEIRKGLNISKRVTGLWIWCRTTRMIMDIDRMIGIKKAELAREEEKDVRGQKHREENADGTVHVDADLRGRSEANVLEECERPGMAGRHERKLGDVGTVPAADPGKDPGGRSEGNRAGQGGGSCESGGGTAEDCLRSRYRNRNRDALRDWQREVMEAEREGRKEMLVL